MERKLKGEVEVKFEGGKRWGRRGMEGDLEDDRIERVYASCLLSGMQLRIEEGSRRVH
jgi:hypothetical protein